MDIMDLYSRYTNTGFQRKELLHPTFEDYIIEMLPKHIYFYLQCEMAWLKETHGFIEMAEDLSCYFLEYCSRFLCEYANNCMRDLQQGFRNICAKVEGQAQRNRDEFFKIHRKLKPLHGYPGNKSMLDDLDLEMEEFFQSKTDESEPFFHEIIADLENKMELFKQKITELDGELKVAKQIFFEKPLNKAIVVQYEATVNYMKSILALKYVADAENVDLKMRILQQLDLLKANLALPFDYVPKVDCVVEDKIEDGTSSSVSSSNEELNCLIQKYDEEMQAIFTEINQMEEKNKDISQQWKDMWVLDKIKISQLYDVKYNLPS